MQDPNALHLALFSRSLCCHVRTASIAFTTYYLVSTLLACAGMAVWAFNGKDLDGFVNNKPLTHGHQMFDMWLVNLFLLVMMAISCIYALVGLRRGCSTPLVPFIVQLYLDVGISLMSLFACSQGLPGAPTIEKTNQLVSYVTGGRGQGPKETARITMILELLFVLYSLVKVYAVHIVTKCYYVLKLAEDAKNSQGVEKGVSVELPSYDDALKLPTKDQPLAFQLL